MCFWFHSHTLTYAAITLSFFTVCSVWLLLFLVITLLLLVSHRPYSGPEESRWWTRTTSSVSPRHESQNSATKQFCFTQCGFNKLWILFCLNFFFLTVLSSVFNFLLSQILKRLYDIKPTTFQSIFFNFIFIIIIITMIYSLQSKKYLCSNSVLCLVFPWMSVFLMTIVLGWGGHVGSPFLSNLYIFGQHLYSWIFSFTLLWL